MTIRLVREGGRYFAVGRGDAHYDVSPDGQRFLMINEEAIAALETALQINPDFVGASMELGRVYLAQGNHNQALAHFDKLRRTGVTPGLLVAISAAYAALAHRRLRQRRKAGARG